MIPEMERRRIATEATLARFRAKAFSWQEGRTCVHLAKAHLKNMGHRTPTLPRFRSALGAKKALKERNWESVVAMLDSLLPRIAPAAMVLGDLVALPGEGGMEAVMICAGPRRVFGWHGSEERTVFVGIGLNEAVGAWRV